MWQHVYVSPLEDHTIQYESWSNKFWVISLLHMIFLGLTMDTGDKNSQRNHDSINTWHLKFIIFFKYL